MEYTLNNCPISRGHLSTDGGDSWTYLNSFPVGFLTIDPDSPSTIYAGQRGSLGLHRSQDGGDTWTQLNDSRYGFGGLVIDPDIPSTLYGSTFNGVSRSLDGGETWLPIGTGLPERTVSSLAIDPLMPSVLYASSAGSVFTLLIDRDSDGVSDTVEDASPLGGDGNGDGIADRNQGHIASLANTTDGEFVTLASPEGMSLSTATATKAPSASRPTGVHFPVGFFGFGLHDLEPGATTTTTLSLPREMSLNSYYKFGPTPDDPTPHWYRFLFDGTTGAEVFSHRIVLHFVDGERGDDDLEANGEIVDVGGPGNQQPLILPYYRQEAGRFTGFAVSNYSPRSATIQYRTYETTGDPAVLSNNPAEFELDEATQLARQGHEIFGNSESSEQLGWVELSTDNPELGSFFQFGSLSLSQLDGSVAFTEPAKKLYLTRVVEGPEAFRGQSATTFVSVVNPNDQPIAVELRLRTEAEGEPVLMEQNRQLATKGFLYETVTQIFGESDTTSTGYVEIEVTEGAGAVAFELIQLADTETVIGLNASFSNRGIESFSAQLASLSDLFTNLNVINTSRGQREVTFTAIGPDGEEATAPVTRVLQSGEQLSQDAVSLLGLDTLTDFVGSLRVVSNGYGIVGDVIFGDSLNYEYAASLPLQTQTFTEAVFSQVANLPGFFTGLAIYNLNPEDAQITIEVISADGAQVGASNQLLAAGQRLSALVPELVPASEGQAGGYVRIRSDRPLIAQQLFGATGPGGIALLSSVPPTVVR